MGLTAKQYEALRTQAIGKARAAGASEAQLDSYDGELFPGEREYLIRMNPPGKKPMSIGMLFVIMCVLGFLISLT
jgi:hypothetical protein